MKYQVELQAIPYKLENGLILQQTAVVKIFNQDNEGISKELRYGYADVASLLSLGSKWTDFKDLYFKDFTISAYLSVLQMDDSNVVHVLQADKCFFDGETDFSKIVYGIGGFSLSHSYIVNGDLTFQEAVFYSDTVSFSANIYGDGNKDFSGTKFYGNEVQFFSSQFNTGDLNFKCSYFEKANLNFSGSSFGNGDVVFDFSYFSSKGVDFSGVEFGNGDTTFRNSNFNGGRVLFFGSSFKNGKVSFSDSVFGDSDVDFSFCNFEGCLVHFKYVNMGQGLLNMSKVTLVGGEILFKGMGLKCKNIIFLESEIECLTFLNGVFSEHVNIQLLQCKKLIVQNCIIEKTFDLLSSKEQRVDIQTLNLVSTKNLGRIYIDWVLNDVKDMIYSQKDTTQYIDKANQFRLLKENFHDIGQYDDEDFAYVEFKRCQSMAQIKGEDISNPRKKRMRMLPRYIIFPFKWLIFDFIGNYATKPLRILGAMLITVLIFSFIYTLPFIELGGYKYFFQNDLLNHFTNGLYHSIQSTFTLGYGDVNPNNLVTLLLSGAESFIGVFMMSYFTAAFVRKLLR